jgi:hypothetical protein
MRRETKEREKNYGSFTALWILVLESYFLPFVYFSHWPTFFSSIFQLIHLRRARPEAIAIEGDSKSVQEAHCELGELSKGFETAFLSLSTRSK